MALGDLRLVTLEKETKWPCGHHWAFPGQEMTENCHIREGGTQELFTEEKLSSKTKKRNLAPSHISMEVQEAGTLKQLRQVEGGKPPPEIFSEPFLMQEVKTVTICCHQ